jgi:hypothetical protein
MCASGIHLKCPDSTAPNEIQSRKPHTIYGVRAACKPLPVVFIRICNCKLATAYGDQHVHTCNLFF